MKSFRCVCGGLLFFDNTRCNRCERAAGWCESCRGIVGLAFSGEMLVCPAGHLLNLCKNGVEHGVCNRYHGLVDQRCAACCLNRTIPDLSIHGHLQRWAQLEAAKRRMLYDLDLTGLAIDFENGKPPLRFDFKTNSLPQDDGRWIMLAGGQKIFTGHSCGLITINIRETDSVEREKNRVNLNETQRTLVGHFRHEVGHYIWDLLIKDRVSVLADFIACFGDPYQPTYGEALAMYYATGPQEDWPQRYVSAYASMHPWEDWAESWHAYLDVLGTLDTLQAFDWLNQQAPAADINTMLDHYAQCSIGLNELNRNRGMPNLITEVFVEPVRVKLGFIHSLVTRIRPPRDVATA